MLNRFILAAAVALCLSVTAQAACSGSSPSYTAASASLADVSACYSSAVDGDTIHIPAGTGDWTSSLTVTKAVIFSGAGVGSTIIRTNTNSTPLMIWTLPAATTTSRITGIEFQNNGATYSDTALGTFIIYGDCGTAQMRVDNNKFDTLAAFTFRHFNGVRGVLDHNEFIFGSSQTPLYPYECNYGDDSMSNNVTWGSTDNLFVEDNTFTSLSNSNSCQDGLSGYRVVFRFNTLVSCLPSGHGTESGGRTRSARSEEVYGNHYSGVLDTFMGVRGGSAMVWGNTSSTASLSAVHLTNDRSVVRFFWGAANGRYVVDLNDAGNPIVSSMASTSGGTRTVTVSGAGWTNDQWVGYSIRKTGAGCAPPLYGYNASYMSPPYVDQCQSVILTNTTDTLTYADGASFVVDMSFTGAFAGDTFEINKVTRALDQPGRGGGTLVVRRHCYSLTSDAAYAATANCIAHGFTTGDWVAMEHGATYNNGFTAQVQVTRVNDDQFTYTCPEICGSNADGYASNIPATNDQIDFPIYQWSNLTNSVNAVTSLVNSCTGICVSNATYYDYGGTAQTSSDNCTTSCAPFDGTPSSSSDPGIGVGRKLQRPTVCTTGVFYWATDEGSWRTTTPTTGDTFQGLGYKCTSTNTWTLNYTPATYPFTASSPCTPDYVAFSTQPSDAGIGVALGTVTVGIYDSGDALCSSATNTITIANKGGTCTGMTLGGTASGAASGGVFITTNLTENASGACTLTASASGLTGGDSSSFTIASSGFDGSGRMRFHR